MPILGWPGAVAAHDIPIDVTVQAFVKPEGPRLTVLIRVPLDAMRDIEYQKRGPGYVDLARVDRPLRDAAQVWISDNLELFEDDVRLASPRLVAARVSWLGDLSFRSYEGALAHFMGPPLPVDANLYWNQGLLDVWFEYATRSDRSKFAIHPKLDRLGTRVVTVLRFLPPGGSVRAFEYAGDPGLVRLDPLWQQTAWRFVSLGFRHILDGRDHLLFLLCLVIPFRRTRPLVAIVTSFTVAHSVTLIAAAYDLGPDALWFPPLVETLIATSIVYMALENIVAGVGVTRRWLVAFGFGLVHGFGYSFALRQTLQFAGSHLLTSVLSFNLGLEIGQLLVLMLLVPALDLLFRVVMAERIGTVIVSALVAHSAWHSMTERAGRLQQYAWPTIGAAGLAALVRGLMVLVAIGALVWLGSVIRRRGRREVSTVGLPTTTPHGLHRSR